MKIAVSDFLNAKPLIQGLELLGEKLILASPFECAEALDKDQVDFALIPSAEYGHIKDLMIIPGVSISSKGPVKSVALFLKKELREVKTVALDQRSRTAAMLLKILSQESLGIDAKFFEMNPDLDEMLKNADGAMLIGDTALRASQGFDGTIIDLGKAWHDLTNLPFTYAFWSGKNKNVSIKNLSHFVDAKEEGIKQIPLIARSVGHCLDQDFVLKYLTDCVCYDWSSEHEEGLKLFYELAVIHGLMNQIPVLRFYHVESYSI